MINILGETLLPKKTNIKTWRVHRFIFNVTTNIPLPSVWDSPYQPKIKSKRKVTNVIICFKNIKGHQIAIIVEKVIDKNNSCTVKFFIENNIVFDLDKRVIPHNLR